MNTTSAGDTFVGALAARLAAGDSLVESVTFGTVVGSATTERRGAGAVVPAELLAGGGRVTSGVWRDSEVPCGDSYHAEEDELLAQTRSRSGSGHQDGES